MSYWKSGLIGNLIGKITQGQERSVKAKKNILASFAIKGMSIAISLILVPLTLNYVDQTEYGIWITLSSVVAWFGLFDIGFGNGLRNKFAEAVAQENFQLARTYVSTTYAILGLIIGAVLLIFFCVNPFLNWSSLLNAPVEMAESLSLVALVVFVFFCIQFTLNLLSTVMMANQEPAKANLIYLLGNVISLVIIFFMMKFTEGSLLNLSFVFSAAPVIVLIGASIWLYKTQYKKFAPSLKYVQFSCARELMNLGLKFFVLQIAAIVMFSTSNILIAQLFTPADVTPYNIAFKYFNVIPMALTIVMSPFWSAYTDAWYKNDIPWIKSTLKKLQMIWLVFSIGTLIMLACADFVYELWVGEDVIVPFSVSLALAIYVITYGWTNIYTTFLNGTGKIKLQLYVSIIGMILNIPLAIFLSKWLGISGIILSTVVIMIFNMVLEPYQTYKLINKTAKGIWNQ